MGDYIKDIRKLIGNMEVQMIGVCALIINEKNEVLLIERTDNDRWSLPGGGLELREKVISGLKREVFEETGIEILDFELIGIVSGEDGLLIYPNKDVVCYTSLVFLVKKYQNEILIHSSEAKSIKFFNKNNIPKSILGPVEEKMINKWIDDDLHLEID